MFRAQIGWTQWLKAPTDIHMTLYVIATHMLGMYLSYKLFP